MEILPYSTPSSLRIICPQVSTNPLIALTLTLYVPQRNLELEGQVQVQNSQATGLQPTPFPASLGSCPHCEELQVRSNGCCRPHAHPNTECFSTERCQQLLSRITACSWLQGSVPSEGEQTQEKGPFNPRSKLCPFRWEGQDLFT